MRRHPLWLAMLSSAVVSAAAFGGEASKTGVIKGTITIGGRPTADAVVSVEGVAPKDGVARPSGNAGQAVIDQRDMKFIPRVLAVLVRTTVDFSNNDKTFHNVFSTSEAKKFDLGLYPSGQSRNVNFDKPGVVRILCNVHPNMEAYIAVKNHRYSPSPTRAETIALAPFLWGNIVLKSGSPNWERGSCRLSWFAKARS